MDRESNRAEGGIRAWHRVVKDYKHTVAGEAIERSLVAVDERSQRAVILAQDSHHVFRLGGLRKRGKAAHIAEQHDDIAPVALEDGLTAGRHNSLRDLRREEPLQPANPFDFTDLRCNPLLKGFAPCSELG